MPDQVVTKTLPVGATNIIPHWNFERLSDHERFYGQSVKRDFDEAYRAAGAEVGGQEAVEMYRKALAKNNDRLVAPINVHEGPSFRGGISSASRWAAGVVLDGEEFHVHQSATEQMVVAVIGGTAKAFSMKKGRGVLEDAEPGKFFHNGPGPGTEHAFVLYRPDGSRADKGEVKILFNAWTMINLNYDTFEPSRVAQREFERVTGFTPRALGH